MSIAVNGNIPHGSIEVVSAADPSDIQLRLIADSASEYMGYYYFRASGVRGVDCNFRIVNAGQILAMRLLGREKIEHAFGNTGPTVSYDRRDWFRIIGALEGEVFSFRHRPEYDICFYSSWAPYSLDREIDFIARAQLSPKVKVTTIGASLDGADIDMLTIGEPGVGKRKCWVIARQHPSEMQGGFFVEAFVGRLLESGDPLIDRLLERAVFYVVPNMNPDGTRRAHTRMNAVGANLNREWESPSLERSPEVFHVRRLMEKIGVDFFIDCHADHELRCNFLGGPLEIPAHTEHQRCLFRDFQHAWAAATPEYELGHPYPGGTPETADTRMAWNWVAERFGCLSILLEQPFKDTSWRQDERCGWSPNRATHFGATLPTALHGVIDKLR